MNFMGLTGFIGGAAYYGCLFVALVLVATAGVFCGKKLRDRKDSKNINKKENETTITQ